MKWTMIIFITFIFVCMLFFHETTHGVIFEEYGCKNITYGVNWKGVYTSAICPDDRSDLPQAINEIVGYNLMPMLLFIITILVVKFNKDEEKKND